MCVRNDKTSSELNVSYTLLTAYLLLARGRKKIRRRRPAGTVAVNYSAKKLFLAISKTTYKSTKIGLMLPQFEQSVDHL